MGKWTFSYDNRSTAILDVLKDGKVVSDSETLRLLNAHEDMLETLKWSRERLVEAFAFEPQGELITKLDAAIAAAESDDGRRKDV